MTIKSVHHQPNFNEVPPNSVAYVIDFFEARRRLSLEPEGTAKEAEIKQGHRKAVYWLISLAGLVSLLVGILCLMEFAPPRAADADQLRLAAGGEPSQAKVTLGQAIQALSVRH